MKLNTKTLSRAGIFAAMYVALTLVCLPVAFGPVQFRPAEGITVLPVFFAESIPALFIGCFLANLFSGYGILDWTVGSLVTLIAAFLTRVIYAKTKNVYLSLIPPVVLNAFIIPIIFLISGSENAYYVDVALMFLTESIYVYGFGLPIYFFVKKERKKGSKLFTD